MSSILRRGTKVHVAATFDGAEMRLYINGALDASKFTPVREVGANWTSLVIGEGWPGTVYCFDGLIDEPMMFSRALTAAEVQSIYAAGTKGLCAPNAADTTPPVIAAAVSGAKGTDEWYTSGVQVSWTVTDPDSTVTSKSGNPRQ